MNDALAAGLDYLDERKRDGADEIAIASARALLVGYADRWADDGWQVVAVEETFRLPILNPNAKRASASRTFDYAGKRDLLISHVDRPDDVYLIDHKSSSENIEDAGDPFWRRLWLDPQPTVYMLAAWQSGVKLAGCIWDVIRKPTIKPLAVPVLDPDGCKVVLDQDGTRVRTKTGAWRQTSDTERGYVLQTRPETAGEFEERFAADIREQPGRFFQRRSVARNDRDMLEFAEEMWGIGQTIVEARRLGRWLKTGATHSCFAYNRPCEYLDLCCGLDSADSPNWVARSSVHSELPGEESNRDLLTHSSMACFRQCQRKYQHRYEQGIQRHDKEDAATLWFGSLIHSAIEIYWNHRPRAVVETSPIASENLLFSMV